MRDRLALHDTQFSLVLPQYDAFRPGDVRFSCASIEKAQRMLSFAPTHTVEQGLEEAMDWYVERAQPAASRATGVTPRHAPAPANNPVHLTGTPLTLAAS
jgi:dTDP-D-glucose 4,6-dehydratase